jgi:long-chain acyl-CoA synthetase
LFDHWLFERMAGWEGRTALVWRDQPWTFRALAEAAAEWQRRLDGIGMAAGASVALVGDFSPDACALMLALFARRAVAVPLRTPTTFHREIACVGTVIELDPPRIQRYAAGDHPLLAQLREQKTPGLVLFSSGSTGAAKASLLDLGRLLQRHREPRPPRTTLAFLQLDHIGGLNTLFHTLATGGTAVFCDARDPDSVCQAIARHRVQLLPTTPTFLRMLLISGAHHRHDLSSLALATYGTEPMPASTLASLHAELPGVALKQTYGLTELGILPTQSRGDSLWLKVGGPGYETKIVSGTLWIRAATAMLGYLNAPSPFDAEGWFNTQDAVEVDGDYLRILGRASELINVGGEKVYPAEVESVLLQAANVSAAVVYGRRNPVTGQVVVARVTTTVPEDPGALRIRLLLFCRTRLAPFQVPALIEVSEGPLHGERFKTRREPASLRCGLVWREGRLPGANPH